MHKETCWISVRCRDLRYQAFNLEECRIKTEREGESCAIFLRKKSILSNRVASNDAYLLLDRFGDRRQECEPIIIDRADYRGPFSHRARSEPRVELGVFSEKPGSLEPPPSPSSYLLHIDEMYTNELVINFFDGRSSAPVRPRVSTRGDPRRVVVLESSGPLTHRVAIYNRNFLTVISQYVTPSERGSQEEHLIPRGGIFW